MPRLGLGRGMSKRRRLSGVTSLAPTYVGVLIYGQSNATGAGAGQAVDNLLDTTDARILQYSPNGGTAAGTPANAHVLKDAIDPLLHPSDGVIVGPGMAFARALLPTLQSHQQIVLIPCAKGGESIVGGVLGVGGTVYNMALSVLAAFKTDYPDSLGAYILFRQGENEVQNNLNPTSSYAGSMDTVLTNFRAVSGWSGAMILVGAMVPEYFEGDTEGPAINLQHAQTPFRLSNSYYVGAVRGAASPGDPVHQTAAGQRLMGAHMQAKIARAITLQTSAAAAPSPSLTAETLTWTSCDCPAYVISVSTDGGSTWTETEYYPTDYNTTATTFTLTAPGTGTRQIRMKSKSVGGDSAWSSTLTYTAPAATVPQGVWDLSYATAPTSGGLFVTVPSIGTDAGDWLPTSSAGTGTASTNAPVTVNGVQAYALASSGRTIKRSVAIPSGSYTFFFGFFYGANGGNNIMLGNGVTGTNTDIQISISSTGIISARHNVTTGGSPITTAALGAPLSKYNAVAVSFDSTTNETKIYHNGILVLTSTLPTRTVTNTITKFFGTNTDASSNGFASGRVISTRLWSEVLTLAQIQTVMASVAAQYTITWG